MFAGKTFARKAGLAAATLGGGAAATYCGTTEDGNWMFPKRMRVSKLPRSGSSSGSDSSNNLLSAIGNTPLIELRSLSAATGVRVLAKCEHLNPGGSIKVGGRLLLLR